jgi:hypothetical protein
MGSPVTTATTGTLSSGFGAFLDKIERRGRLIFALDATASRQATWDQASHLQAQMFETVANVGGLDVQLIYFRGWGECKASKWVSDARQLRSIMTGLMCKSGHTQIRRVLDHVRRENQREPVNAVVFVGDACEETPADLYDSCPDIPLFMFQENEDEAVRDVFAQIAKLTKGAHVAFNSNSVVTLAELLKAVATFATGGVEALADQNSDAARLLLTQVRK